MTCLDYEGHTSMEGKKNPAGAGFFCDRNER